MDGQSSFTRSIIDQLHSSDIQQDAMEGKGCVTRIIIDELHSLDMVKWKVKVVLFEESMINFIVCIAKKIKWQVKVV